MIVHRAKQWDGETELYAKRVIGIPGDKIRTSGSRVFVNGAALPHVQLRTENSLTICEETHEGANYLIGLQLTPAPTWSTPNVELTVPRDSFFLMGDNRMHSADSRYTGCVLWSDIVGKIVGR